MFPINTLIFNCTFSASGWILIGNVYQCQSTPIFSGKDVLEDVQGTHLEGNGDADVKALAFNEQNVRKFPQGIENFFPNLIALRCANSGLIEISAEDLKPFSGLRVLWLPYNKLISIDSDLFKYTPRLQVINVAVNKIESVGTEAFAVLDDLSYFSFFYNPCFNGEAVNRAGVLELIANIESNCSHLSVKKIL